MECFSNWKFSRTASSVSLVDKMTYSMPIPTWIDLELYPTRLIGPTPCSNCLRSYWRSYSRFWGHCVHANLEQVLGKSLLKLQHTIIEYVRYCNHIALYLTCLLLASQFHFFPKCYVSFRALITSLISRHTNYRWQICKTRAQREKFKFLL
jgi:hypothetical protein